MVEEKIYCDIIPKYCWYYDGGEIKCDYIYKINPIQTINIKEFIIYKENGRIINIRLLKKYYHPNFDKDGFICNSIFCKKRKYNLNKEEIIRTMIHYHFTSYFEKPKNMEIFLMRYDLNKNKKNIFSLKI